MIIFKFYSFFPLAINQPLMGTIHLLGPYEHINAGKVPSFPQLYIMVLLP